MVSLSRTDEPYPCSKNPGEEAAHKAAGENILSGDVQAGNVSLGPKSTAITTNIPNMNPDPAKSSDPTGSGSTTLQGTVLHNNQGNE